MTEKEKVIAETEEKEQETKKQDLQIDWALEASFELQDYIEEQGIQIRY